MNFRKNLKQEGFSAEMKLLIATMFLLMGIWYYFQNIKGELHVDIFDYVYLIFFGGVSLVLFVASLIGMKKHPYVAVDDNSFTFLLDEKDFFTLIEWKDVSELKVNDLQIEFYKKSGSFEKFPLIRLKEKDENELLELLSVLVEHYNIKLDGLS